MLHLTELRGISEKSSSIQISLTVAKTYYIIGASLVVLVVKNPPAKAGGVRDVGSIPGSERCPGGGCSNPLQYFCLGNPMDRGAWWAIVRGVSESDMTEVT